MKVTAIHTVSSKLFDTQQQKLRHQQSIN